MTLFLTIFTATAYLILAVLVYSRNSRHPAHQSISLLSLCLAGWAVSNWLSLQDVSVEQRFFWVKVVMMITIPIPWLFLRFGLYFPVTKNNYPSNSPRRRIKKIMPLLGFWTIFLMIISFTPLMFRQYWFEDGLPHLETGLGATAYGLTFFLLTLVSTGLIFRTYTWQTGLARLQSAYVLFGLCLTTAFAFSTNFILVTIFQRFEFVSIGPVSTLFLLGCICYAMLKHRLLDLRLAVLRCVAYVITLGVITFIYCFVISDLFLHLRTYLPLSEQTMTVIGMIGAILSFPFLLRTTQRMTQHLFYKTLFQPDRAHRIMAGITANTVSLKLLMRELDGFFCTQLGVSWTGVLLTQKAEPSELKQVLQSLYEAEETQSLVVFDELQEGETKLLLRVQKVMVAIPLQMQGKLLGWVCCGPKHSGGAFSAEELQFCSVVGPQIALALHHLGQLDQMKDEFVSIASHELRTPMTAIRSYLWLCLFKPSLVIPDPVRQHLQIAYNATERLLELVRDLLMLSQLESHRLPLKLENVPLEEVVRNVTKELELSTHTKKVQLMFNVALKDSYCLVDQTKVGEILHNLIGNAIKFSASSSQVVITLGGNNRQLSVMIKDSGPGISEQDQERLFQKFGVVQHSYRKSPESGTGLGLYIAQQLAKLHQGSITVFSQLGKGTTFTLTLPRQMNATYAKATLSSY